MSAGSADAKRGRAVKLAVVVAALGYFVDIYDLILFSIVRKSSLLGLGVPPERVLDTGVLLINMQMGGMLLGGIFWGILGDKRGRLSVLFGSIVLYSLANVANAFVPNVEAYAVTRFIAGVGLAGELGAGITLVSESLSKETRGYGTTIVATVGITGAVVGALVAGLVPWQTSYLIGGGLGLALLVLRIGVYESGMFEKLKATRGVSRGNLFLLFSSWRRASRYLGVILVGVPIWYAVGVLVTFSPEIGAALGMSPAPEAAKAVMYCYIGLALGDFGSGALSQLLRSRKRVLFGFLLLTALAIAAYFTLGSASTTAFYAVCVLLGFATGYWAVFVTVASEQFGTNVRATATTTVPNFVRGAVVPLTLAFTALQRSVGVPGAAIAIGVVTMLVALGALATLDETYGKDLEFHET
ncbi:MAG: MFS transporter [Polyangiaceae bacterium]|nr:MFS transporter [Polyangiaceae bacterium]